MKIKYFLYFFITLLIIISTAIIYRTITIESLKTSIYKTKTIETSIESNKINNTGILASQLKEDYFPSNGKIISLNYKVGDSILEGQVLASIEKEKFPETENIIALKSGTVTSIQYSVGEYYDSKKPIITTEDLSYMKVLVNLESDEYEYIRLNQKAIISTQFLQFKGKISYISPTGVGDYTNSSKSYLPIEITLDGKLDNLKSGIKVNVSIIIEEKQNIIAIDSSIIKKDLNGTYVYILKDDMAHKRYIKTATQFSDKLEITEGLNKNDVVILDPNNSLVEGQKIIPEESIPVNSPLYTK